LKNTISRLYQFQILERVKIIPSVSYNLIGRYGENWEQLSHLAWSKFRFAIRTSDSFDIELMAQGLN
jgi:hypothetical protein